MSGIFAVSAIRPLLLQIPYDFSSIFSRSCKTAELQRLLLPLFLSVSVKVDFSSSRSI